MERTYPVNIVVKLKPIWFREPPTVRVGLDGEYRQTSLRDTITYYYHLNKPAGVHHLEVELLGKTDLDSDMANGYDTAVVIEEIEFNGITNPKFGWSGIYRPNYPHHTQGEPELTNHTYLGWNGIWTLEFTTPIYTWIHNIENLGWIYE